jgi:hypothetical protein
MPDESAPAMRNPSRRNGAICPSICQLAKRICHITLSISSSLLRACCVNFFYYSSPSSNPGFKHFTAEGAEELRDRKIE